MSGGSMEYMYSKDPLEQLGLLRRYLDTIETVFADAMTCKVGHGKDERESTPIERAAALIALHELRALASEAGQLAARIDTLSDVLQSVEWTRSCDTCPDSVLRAAEEWLSQRAGVKSLAAIVAEQSAPSRES